MGLLTQPPERGLFGRIGSGIRDVFAGPEDPSLTPEQNRAARSRALIQSGLSTIAMGGERSPLQAIALGAMAGQKYGDQQRAGFAQQAARDKLNGAFPNGTPDRAALQRLMLDMMKAGDIEGARTLAELIKSMPEGSGPKMTLTRPTAEGSYSVTGSPEEVGGVAGTLPAAKNDENTINVYGRKFEDTPEGTKKALEWIDQYNKANTKAGAEGPKDTLDMMARYGTDKIVQDSTVIAMNYARIQAVADNPSAAGDLSMIFSYMKMLDPGSTVRESEFANAQNAGGVDTRTRAWWNRLRNGERLTVEQRADFINQADAVARRQRTLLQPVNRRYSELATHFGANPAYVVSDPFDSVIGKSTPAAGGGASTPEGAALLNLLKMGGGK